MVRRASSVHLITALVTASLTLAFFFPLGTQAATTISTSTFPNTGAVTWTKAGSPYVVTMPVSKRFGSLTLEPGVVVKLLPAATLSTHADVVTTIVGTAEEPIYFTSYKDDSVGGDTNGDGAATVPAPGDWGSVSFGSGSWNNSMSLEYLKIRYGGATSISTVQGTKFYALFILYPWFSGSPGRGYTLSRVEVSHSSGIGLLVSVGQGNSLSVSQSSFYNNAEHGLYRRYTTNLSGALVSGPVGAPENWWGDVSGPYHPSLNPTGLGDPVDPTTLHVNLGGSIAFTPWLSVDPVPDPVPEPTCCSNIAFLPGIESSRLYRPDYAGGTDRLWEPGENNDVRDLYLDINGDGLRDDVYTRVGDVLDETPAGANIYKSFMQKMDALTAADQINDWEPIAYDWRLSLDDILSNGNEVNGKIYYTGLLAATTTPYVLQELRHLAQTSRTGKVTIVAHSNGGLLTKRLTEVLGSEASQLIDKIIFVAVPQVGTPQAVAAGLHGYGQQFVFGLVLSSNVARSFASTSPMFYNLLPSASYYTYVDDPVVKFSPTLPDWQGRYGSTIHSSELLRNFVTDSYGRVDAETGDIDQPIQLRAALYDAAAVLHSSLDTWVPPAGVEVIQIAGWGVPSTVKGITYSKKGVGVKPEPEFTVDGDGTVVVPSALWTSGVTNYWVDLAKYNRISNRIATGHILGVKHSNILDITEVVDYLGDSLTSLLRPLPEYTYFSSESPVSSELRLRFSLHSPLNIVAYDNQGRFTGISTSTGNLVEGIPGTYYTEFGESKYIFSDAGLPLRIYMDGYDTGTFTLNIDELNGDNMVASTTFKNLPTTSDTRVEIGTDSGVASLSPLLLDKNGDGTTDASLAPKLNDIVTLDETPPVSVLTITGTQGLGGWHVSSTSLSIVATDSESGVKNTYYSLGGAATTTGNTAVIDTEGVHSLGYYSEDNAGNVEIPQYASVKIDKTPPEVVLGASTVARDLLITGKDNLSSATVVTAGTTTTVTDQAGNVTKLAFQKTYSGKNLTYARLTSIKYGEEAPIALPSAFTYLWDSTGTLVSQTVVVDNQFIVQALYSKSKNKTTIVVLKKNVPIQTSSVAGLVLIKLTTSRGNISYSW